MALRLCVLSAVALASALFIAPEPAGAQEQQAMAEALQQRLDAIEHIDGYMASRRSELCGEYSITGAAMRYAACANRSARVMRYAEWPIIRVLRRNEVCIGQTEDNCLTYTRFPTREQADAFANAWTVLVAAAHQAASPSPASGSTGAFDAEAVRRAQISAEVSLEEGRRADAVRAYAEALATYPAWANGHYNLALILGDLELYPDAIQQMNIYIALLPDTADRRAVQDQIYRWEAQSSP